MNFSSTKENVQYRKKIVPENNEINTGHKNGASQTPPMLKYFPKPFPSESAYSIFARCIRHIGLNSSGRFALYLLGFTHRCRDIDFSSRLGLLASKTPLSYELDALAILLNHTTFPYYAYHMPKRHRDKAIAARLSPTPLCWSYAGPWRPIKPDKSIRFCPYCLLEMHSDYGEFYWKREHQIRTVLVCPDHGCVLRLANMTGIEKGHLLPATETTCAIDAPPVVENLTEQERIALHKISLRSKALLDQSSAIVCTDHDPIEYHNVMRTKDFRCGLVLAKAEIFKQSFLQEFGHLGRIWPELFQKKSIRGAGAVDTIVGACAENKDPVLCIMLDILLAETPNILPSFLKRI